MDKQKLKKICNEVISQNKYQPRDNKTFCNLAVAEICEKLGFRFFYKNKTIMLANEMYIFLKNDFRFSIINTEQAIKKAQEGKLVIAAQQGKPHGHITVIYPEGSVYSEKWKKQVPLCANVGKTNGIIGINWAFQVEPEYFLYIGETV